MGASKSLTFRLLTSLHGQHWILAKSQLLLTFSGRGGKGGNGGNGGNILIAVLEGTLAATVTAQQFKLDNSGGHGGEGGPGGPGGSAGAGEWLSRSTITLFNLSRFNGSPLWRVLPRVSLFTIGFGTHRRLAWLGGKEWQMVLRPRP